jgi:RNA polymerase sigma-70 factor (ECF subfamily)
MDTFTPGAPAQVAAGPEPSDHALLRRLREGNQDAATQLYLRYARRLQYLARSQCPADLAARLDPEDLVQSIFASFFRGVGLGYYDVPRGDDLWKLLVIALNKVRARCNFHRAARRDVRLTASSERLDEPGPARPADGMAHTFLQLVINETLARLPASHQQAVQLRIEGYEVAEIADRVGRSRRTVERVLQEFRQFLAGALHEDA